MARARNIKPGFFKNEDLAECTPFARLCFAGLWTMADRRGILEDRAKRIKGELFAYDSVDVEPLLCELARWKFIERYEVQGERLIQILSFQTHQNPHKDEKESDFPGLPGHQYRVRKTINADVDGEEHGAETGHQMQTTPGNTGASTVLAQCQPPLEEGINPAESLSPITDTGFLTPDSRTLKPESGTPIQKPFDPPPAEDGSAPAAAVATLVKVVKAKAPKDEAPTVGTWKAYSQAYGVRYSVEPVRNATVNGQLANLVSRLGAEEAPAVAAFYVRSNNGRYVAAGHSVGMLVMDAEKLRTEWATGRQGTTTQAQQADKTATNLNAFAGLLAEAQAKDNHAQH